MAGCSGRFPQLAHPCGPLRFVQTASLRSPRATVASIDDASARARRPPLQSAALGTRPSRGGGVAGRGVPRETTIPSAKPTFYERDTQGPRRFAGVATRRSSLKLTLKSAMDMRSSRNDPVRADRDSNRDNVVQRRGPTLQQRSGPVVDPRWPLLAAGICWSARRRRCNGATSRERTRAVGRLRCMTRRCRRAD